MNPTILIILISVGVVGFFVLGMSLTLIFKGHHIQSEIGENENMKARGIKCAAQQMRDEERALRGGVAAADGCGPEPCPPTGCSGCGNY